jgi:hypothetical protein
MQVPCWACRECVSEIASGCNVASTHEIVSVVLLCAAAHLVGSAAKIGEHSLVAKPDRRVSLPHHSTWPGLPTEGSRDNARIRTVTILLDYPQPYPVAAYSLRGKLSYMLVADRFRAVVEEPPMSNAHT